MALDAKQKRFIRKKVRKLGSYKAATKFYNREDAVSEYAEKMATNFFGRTIKRREKK